MKNTYHFSGVASCDFVISIDANTEGEARAQVASSLMLWPGDMSIDIYDCDVEEDTGEDESQSSDKAVTHEG